MTSAVKGEYNLKKAVAITINKITTATIQAWKII